MDDIRDQMAVSNEISEAIARPALGNEIDDDELREELEQLEQEELDNKLVGVDVPSQRMPTAPERRTPSTSVVTYILEPVQKSKEEEDEEAELRALQAEMAIWVYALLVVLLTLVAYILFIAEGHRRGSVWFALVGFIMIGRSVVFCSVAVMLSVRR